VDDAAGEFAQPIAIGKNQPTVTTADIREAILDIVAQGDELLPVIPDGE